LVQICGGKDIYVDAGASKFIFNKVGLKLSVCPQNVSSISKKFGM